MPSIYLAFYIQHMPKIYIYISTYLQQKYGVYFTVNINHVQTMGYGAALDVWACVGMRACACMLLQWFDGGMAILYILYIGAVCGW